MSTDLLQRLIEAGTPAALVAEVAQALNAADMEARAIDRRRAADAARQQARRDRLKAEASSRDITPNHVTSRDVMEDHVTARDEAPSSDKSPLNPKINSTPHGCETGAHVHVREAAIPGWLLPDLISLQLVAHLAAMTASRDAARNALWNGTPPPPGVSDECWGGFLAHRRAMPKAGKFTARAYELLCEKLVKLSTDEWPPGKLLDEAIDRNWITVFPPKDARNDNAPRHPGRRQQGQFRDPLLNGDPADIGLAG